MNPLLAHLIGGLAVIGALAGLAAAGTITGAEALAPILAIGGILVGTTATTVGSTPAPGTTTITTKPDTSTQPPITPLP